MTNNAVSTHSQGVNPVDLLENARKHVLAKEYNTAVDELVQLTTFSEALGRALALYGVIAYHNRNYAMAIGLFRRAMDYKDASGDIPEVLAVLYAISGNLTESLFHSKLAATQTVDRNVLDLLGRDFPRFSDVFGNIGSRPFFEQGRRHLVWGEFDKAVQWLEQHAQIFPRDYEALAVLADALMASGAHRAAVATLRSLRAGTPNDAVSAGRLGIALTRVGFFAEARACLTLARALAPNNKQVLCDLIKHFDYSPHLSTARVEETLTTLRTLVGPEETLGTPSRGKVSKTVKVGYLVGSLESEDEASMIANIVARHDRGRVRPIGYGVGTLAAKRNIPFRNRFDRWVNIQGMDPYTVSAMMENEGVEVLVDACGVHDPNHLSLFPLHAAPVQVSWLGSPLGVAAHGVDYRFVDALAPAEKGADGCAPWPLSTGLYHLHMALVPPPSDGPADTNGYVAFGVDAELGQINAEAALAWARILLAVPGSQLLLFDRDISHPENVNRLTNLFGSFGVAQRVDVVRAKDRWEFMREIDVLLTPFPHASPFAAAAALGAGVPVVALDQAGRTCQQVAFMLRRVGLEETSVGASIDEYVALAVRWSGDAEARRRVRVEEVVGYRGTPAFDVGLFVAGLEDAFVAMRDVARSR